MLNQDEARELTLQYYDRAIGRGLDCYIGADVGETKRETLQLRLFAAYPEYVIYFAKMLPGILPREMAALVMDRARDIRVH